MVVPFVHGCVAWLVWVGGSAGPGGATNARSTGGVCGVGRQAAKTSTIRAREPSMAVAQLRAFMCMGLSFLLRVGQVGNELGRSA
jgi:hypothetical protein